MVGIEGVGQPPNLPIAVGLFRNGKLGLTDVLKEALKTSGDLAVPFIPVVAAWLCVKFECVVALL